MIAERDNYKAQLTALQMTNEQLELEIKKLRSELALLQSVKSKQLAIASLTNNEVE